MPPLKKQNKRTKKKSTKKTNVKQKSFTHLPIITEEQKEFYLDQINSFEPRLIKYEKRCDELELMCRSYGDQFEILLKDKRDISSYLKKQLELRNEQVFDLNDRLIGLQQAKDSEKEFFEKTLHDIKEKARIEIDKLENENIFLKSRLAALDEFKYQRQTMETTIDELKDLIRKKEDAYKQALEQMEIALIRFKNRLKKEAIQYLNDLAIEFRHNTKNQISNTIKRAIHENFYLNNQMDYLSSQLEKTIEINKKSTEDNQQLTRTVTILEDIQSQSAQKYFATENIIRMLCKKLKECREQKANSSNEFILPMQSTEKDSIKTISNEENNIQYDEQKSIEIKYLKEENKLLRDIIDQAAITITDVLQSQDNSDEMFKMEKRNEMLEQFLSLLLTSHHLGRSELLLLQKKSPLLKGIFPGTRLGLHRIRPDTSIKAQTHYHLGDLGLVPSDKNTDTTNAN